MSTASEYNERPPVFVRSSDPQDPYNKAATEYDNIIGSAIIRAKNWRYCAYLSLTLSIILAVGLIAQSFKSTVTPYVIEVDSTTGMARAIGPAKEGTYNPQDAEIKYFIKQFIMNTRTVPIDAVLFNKNWDNARALMRKNLAVKMNQMFETDTQMNSFGKQTVLPTIVSINKATKDTYQVRWTEEVYDLSGGRKYIVPMTGLFTIELDQPRDEATLQANPIGVYISDLNWSKDQK